VIPLQFLCTIGIHRSCSSTERLTAEIEVVRAWCSPDAHSARSTPVIVHQESLQPDTARPPLTEVLRGSSTLPIYHR
jgi:hypothetical protein